MSQRTWILILLVSVILAGVAGFTLAPGSAEDAGNWHDEFISCVDNYMVLQAEAYHEGETVFHRSE